MLATKTPDSFGFKSAFDRNWSSSDLSPYFDNRAANETAKRRAYWVAFCLGRCRLTGTTLEGEAQGEGLLPDAIALDAALLLAAHTESWIAAAERFALRYKAADEMDFEAREGCFELVNARVEAWAVWVAVDAVRQDVACGVAGGVSVSNAAELISSAARVVALVESFDASLQKIRNLLVVVAGTNFLSNWREIVVEPYSANIPWCLSGALEKDVDAATPAVRVDWRAVEAASLEGPVLSGDRLCRDAEEPVPPTEACPCCDYVTLRSRWNYELCRVCYWEDGDEQHWDTSLAQARANFVKYGSMYDDCDVLLCSSEERAKFEHRPR